MSLDEETQIFRTPDSDDKGFYLKIKAMKADPKGYDIGMHKDEDINNAMKQCNLFTQLAAKEELDNHHIEWMDELVEDYLDAYNKERLGPLVMGSYAARPVDKTGKD